MATLIPEALTDLNQLETYLSASATFPTSDSDIFIQLINTTTQFCLTYTRRKSFKYKTISSELHDGLGTTKVITKFHPIISITDIYDDTARNYAVGSLISASNYQVFSADGGIIRRFDSYFNSGVSNIKLGYVAGFSNYDVMEYFNDQIIVNEGASNITVTLTAGDYNSSTLAAQMQTDLNADSSTTLTYTVVYTEASHRYKITVASGTFSLPWTVAGSRHKEFGKLLGFYIGTDDAASASQVSDYPALGLPLDLVEAINTIVRYRYEEIRERRIGKSSESTDMGSMTFNYNGVPGFSLDLLSPYIMLSL